MQILHRGIFMPAFDRILQLARMEEMDCEFVEVTAHEGARPTHAVWQGRVYHRGGAVVQDGERYEDFETATGYGTGPGLCGWNCRHNFYPFYPGVSVRNYTDERLAELDARSGACRTGRLRRGGPHGERHQEPKPGRVSRLVKRAGADTTLKNAVRDGAEWAWVPHGDTCPFCITLASNGWQKASSKVLKGGHADHIHANCDCEFAIRFDHNTTVAGYDPDKYLKQYRDAGGDINKMRRVNYAANIDHGIDTSGILTMDYSGFKAVSIAAKDCAAPARYIIQGTKGYILQKSTANCCGGITFHPNEGKEEHYNLNGDRPRQAAEFEAFYRAMTAGDQELCARMLDTSIAVSRVLTVARRSAGVRFPGDRF